MKCSRSQRKKVFKRKRVIKSTISNDSSNQMKTMNWILGFSRVQIHGGTNRSSCRQCLGTRLEQLQIMKRGGRHRNRIGNRQCARVSG